MNATFQSLLRLAREDKARREAATLAPVVVWAQRGGETPESFAVRSTRIRERHEGARVLACVPADFPVPDGMRAIELPPKAHAQLHPGMRARYRVPYGGRGAGKSHSIARAALLRAMAGPIRVGCFREYQNSIRESVHRLLSDSIAALGLNRWFDVGVQSITSHCGGEFIFEGLHGNTNKIRSLEGVDLAWIEEAATVSEVSWETLIPTIRTKGSELWINLNPVDEDAPTYKRFIAKPPPDALIEHYTFRDNPYFPAELEAERQYLERVDPDAYAHVWEGTCRQVSDAQVFRGKFIIEAFEPGEGFDGPYLGADWGFSQDPTTLVKCWVHERTLFIEFEAYGVGVDIDKLPAMFDRVPGARQSIIRADSARPETISYMVQHGYPQVRAVEKWAGSVEDGISFLRQFEQIVIHPRCNHAAQEFRLYSYKVDRLSGDVLPDLVDADNHVIDAVRYALGPLIKLGAGMGLFNFIKDAVGAANAATAAKASAPQPSTGMTATSAVKKDAPLMTPAEQADRNARQVDLERRHGFGTARGGRITDLR